MNCIFIANNRSTCPYCKNSDNLLSKTEREVKEAFNQADVDDTIWYDDKTTLLEEVLHRIERVLEHHC